MLNQFISTFTYGTAELPEENGIFAADETLVESRNCSRCKAGSSSDSNSNDRTCRVLQLVVQTALKTLRSVKNNMLAVNTGNTLKLPRFKGRVRFLISSFDK